MMRKDIDEMELKRSHQWLTETEPSSLQLFTSNKRQAVQTDPHMNSSSTRDTSLVHRELTDGLFNPTIAHTINNSSFKLNQVSETESMVQFYGKGVPRSFETAPSYDTVEDSMLSFGQTCSNIDKSYILPGPFVTKADGNFTNEGVGVVPLCDSCDKGDGNVLSTFHPLEKGVEDFRLMGQSLQKADCNVLSMNPSIPSYNKGQGNFMSLGSCNKVPENLIMAGSHYNKENVNGLSSGWSPSMQAGEMAFTVSSQNRADQVSHVDTSKTISFGDDQKEPTFENFNPSSETAKDPPHTETTGNISFASTADTLVVPKSKDSKTAKKGSRNTFPANVKSLLSTGMFDGVTVKYYSWSHEKNLRGVIKGTGYLCGCDNCNLTKVLNAYEFEQHANCKTKHPNNHIYFGNGKSIYGVVQELKNTPQEKLFDAIQTVTGSDINHTKFNSWKASYQVATLEIQRIFGKKDALPLPSSEDK